MDKGITPPVGGDTLRIIGRSSAVASAALTRFSGSKSESAASRFKGRMTQHLSAVSLSTTSQ